MISTLQFEALDGSYLQVSVQRADVRVTAYRFESLCIDTRICPVEPSFPRQVVFSQILEGGVAWLGPSPWEENDSLGSVAPSNLYFGNDAPWKRRTLESTLGISLWVPAEASRPFEEPGPLPNIGIPAVRDLAFHLLEKGDTADLAQTNDWIDAWLLRLQQLDLLSVPRESMPPRAPVDPSMMQALTRVLRAAASQPRVCDLASALNQSERQISRRLRKALPAIGSPSTTFREASHRWRIGIACILLASRPNERISVIAKQSGFSGTAALDHCFQRAGLASPQELRDRIRHE